jgi:hypothetical protein
MDLSPHTKGIAVLPQLGGGYFAGLRGTVWTHGACPLQRDDKRLVIALYRTRRQDTHRPWLLLDSHDEVRAILRWGNISAEELAEHEGSIRRWGVSSAVLNLTDQQLAALIERGRGWPWNGYELRLMKEAGKYPPQRSIERKR